MAVFRIEKSKDYTVMSNYHLRDNSLSLKAKGLLSQMLSLPEGWDYTLAGLSMINKESKDAIRAAVNELEDAGYVQRHQTVDASGKFSCNEYVIHEQPFFEEPLSENPTTENPSPDNPTELNIDISSTDKSKENKKRKSAEECSQKRTPPDKDFDPLPLFIEWIRATLAEDWDPGELNFLYAALVRFAENRKALKKPMKTKGAVTALCNRLMRMSGGDIPMMIDMLDTATCNGWQTVYAPKDGGQYNKPSGNSGRVWECL